MTANLSRQTIVSFGFPAFCRFECSESRGEGFIGQRSDHYHAFNALWCRFADQESWRARHVEGGCFSAIFVNGSNELSALHTRGKRYRVQAQALCMRKKVRFGQLVWIRDQHLAHFPKALL